MKLTMGIARVLVPWFLALNIASALHPHLEPFRGKAVTLFELLLKDFLAGSLDVSKGLL